MHWILNPKDDDTLDNPLTIILHHAVSFNMYYITLFASLFVFPYFRPIVLCSIVQSVHPPYLNLYASCLYFARPSKSANSSFFSAAFSTLTQSTKFNVTSTLRNKLTYRNHRNHFHWHVFIHIGMLDFIYSMPVT
jgi:hypothetical protein